MDEKLEMALKGGTFRYLVENQLTGIRKKYGLKKVDLEVLYFLAHNSDKDTPTSIYHGLKINRGHVSQAIDALYKKSLISAAPDEIDRRHMHYAITEAADEIVADMEKIHNYLDEVIFFGLSQEEIEQYKKTTDKILNNIEKICKKDM